MPDKKIPPFPMPPGNPLAGDSGRRMLPGELTAGSGGGWFKTEIVHLTVGFFIGFLVFIGIRAAGYDNRLAAGAGIVTLLLSRVVTRYLVPDHKLEVAAAVLSAGPPADTVREIIETVVFVVVLVLLMKSFIAEAFVIPTGSMATTLWGYQKLVDCPVCGFHFPVNCSNEADPQEGHQAVPVQGCTCPNCRYPIDFNQEHQHGWEVPGWTTGDRVLVIKYLYDLLAKTPDRLDVVVFKFPGDNGPSAPWPQSGPYSKNHMPVNYIKRLIGLPGEIIAIHEGNLYSIPRDKVPEEERKGFAADAVEAAKDGSPQLWQTKFTHTKEGEEARDFFTKYHDLFQIIRKPPETMLTMRRIVHDNDFSARDLQGDKWARWTGDFAWTQVGHSFRHAAGGNAIADPGLATDWIHYHHLLRNGGGRPQLITDFMGYNTGVSNGAARQTGVNWVGDLMLECEVTVEKTEGTLTLELSRGVDRFQARFNLATGTCKLVRLIGIGEQELGSEQTAMKKPGKYRLRFSDFDERLTVWVDNALPFGDGMVYTAAIDRGPRAENDLERPVSVGAQNAEVQIDHLQVWRDTYYTIGERSPGDPDVQVDLSDPFTWGPMKEMPVRTMEVQPDHLLCLGDNSPESSDSRTWGLVPERLLLGRALLVYYPFNRSGRIR